MTLRDLTRRHAQEIVRADQLGELATWHPKDGSGDRDLLVVISRQQAEPIADPVESATVQQARVFVPFSDDPTKGITTVVDGDEITLELVRGAAPVRCRVAELVASGMGGFRIRVVA